MFKVERPGLSVRFTGGPPMSCVQTAVAGGNSALGPLAGRLLLSTTEMMDLQVFRVNLAAKGGSFKLHKLLDSVLSWLQHWSQEAQQELWGRLEPALKAFQEPCNALSQVSSI